MPQNTLARIQEEFLLEARSADTHLDFETLSAYLDGILEAQMRVEVQDHLATCGQCQGEFQAMDRMRQEIRDSPAKTYAPAHSPGIFVGISHWPRVPSWRLALASGVSVLLVVAIFLGLHPSPTIVPIVASKPHNLTSPLPGRKIEMSEPNDLGKLGANDTVHHTQQENGPILKSPQREQITSDRPTFVWFPFSEAQEYRVFLQRDNGTHLVTTSGRIEQTYWTVKQPLQPGTSYQWTVQAYVGKEKIGNLSTSAHFHTR
jgi:hypothetical protein